MPEELTKLQQIILDVDALALPLREAMRITTQRAGFFVGQHRYLEERSKAYAAIGQEEPAVVY
jgi:hypothetical protein